ncbi:MAG TPA: DUF177 domain-containing protein [Terriglobia bacterium]|nr:DUF177 domain-containing protein [Terriglobia bacterium]
MLISVEELKLHPVAISQTYPAGALDYHTAEFHQLGNLNVRGTTELIGGEIRIRGHLSGRVEQSCDRCLAPVEVPVECDLDLTYQPMAAIARNEEVEVSADELEVGFFTGPGVELDDAVAEQVNLFMPMQVVCGPDCRGLCPTCGANRNLEACHCAAGSEPSPFAALLNE